MSIICIDYGVNHCGVAMSIGSIAEPLETVDTKDIIKFCHNLTKQYQINKIVLGMSEGDMAVTIKKFSKLLKQHINLPMEFHDETLSSFETRKMLAQAGVKKKKRESKVDHFVAANILNDYLDSHKPKDLLQ